MTVQYVSSNEFASLVNQLQLTPEDPHLKRQVIKYVPEMKKLAEIHPLALYHLAHIYPPKSSQYKQAILQAADAGCTNAMLTACQILATSDKIEDLEKAALYVVEINNSNDQYIIERCGELVDKHPQLAQFMKPQPINAHSHYNMHRFFTAPAVNVVAEEELNLSKSLS